MRNSGIIGLIILAIICYAIIAIGIAAAIIVACIVLFYLIRWLINTIRDNKVKSNQKTLFINKLCSSYNITEKNVSNKNKQLLAIIDEILTKYSYAQEIEHEFNNFEESVKISFSDTTVWKNKHRLEDYSYKSGSLSRKPFKYKKNGFLGSKHHLCFNYFTIESGKTKLHFYPCFVITEIDCQYDIVKYNELAFGEKESISVEESSWTTINGATPAYYNYLHERIGGGPDRRYKDNPSIPVYLYNTLVFYASKDNQLIFASQETQSKFIKCIKNYQQCLKKYPIQSRISIKDIVLENNEYASLIKKIIAEHGNDIILSKTFINLLKDYGIPKEHPYFIPILEHLSKSSDLQQISQIDCKYHHLDNIRNNIKHSTRFSEKEISMVLAILAHSLHMQKE